MTVVGAPKLGLVNGWNGAVEGSLEVCCVGQSQEIDLGNWQVTAVLGKHLVFLESTVFYDESYVIWPKVAAISSAENSNSPFTDAKRPYGSARHLPNVNFSNIFASFAQSPCMPCFAPSDQS